MVEMVRFIAYVDDWGNSRSWVMASDSQLKLTAMDGYTMLFAVKIDGDSMIITGEDGSVARGMRSK